MPENKKIKGSLFTRILIAMICFVTFMVSVLWIAQIGFLDSMYKGIRTSQVKKITNVISDNLDYDDIKETEIPGLAENNTAIIVRDNLTRIQYIANSEMLTRIMGRDVNIKVPQLLRMVDNSDLDIFYITSAKGRGLFDDIETQITTDSEEQNINAVAYVTNSEDNLFTVIGIGMVTPVNATRDTLKRQLAVISVLFVLIALIISYIVARAISRPLESITSNAEEMSRGNYDIQFHGSGFSEIQVLSDTLNFTAEQLKKSDQLTKDLIANVSHDLRTPLTMISGYGEVMRDIPGEATPENIQVIIDEANRLTRLVNGMMDISKLQSGTAEISKSAVNANELINKIYNTYNTLLENSEYHFVVETDSELYVSGDAGRLEQVLYNLVNNAINHAGDDKTVILKCHREGKKARFDVIDHGIGIKKEDQPLIWNRYYRVNKNKETGSGLGLSIVKTILELHKAEYGVESEVGKGSDFWFKLPLLEE